MRADMFNSIFQHYLVLALDQAGVAVNSDTYAELERAFDDLDDVLDQLHDRILELERRNEPTSTADIPGVVTWTNADDGRAAFYAMLNRHRVERLLAEEMTEEE